MASSKITIKQTQPKRVQIKIKILKMFPKSSNGVAGKQTKVTGNDVIKKNRPMRGQIKVKIFKMFYNLIEDLTNGVVVGKKKAAGNRCFTSPAAVIPVDNVGEMELDAGGEKGTIKIEIRIRKSIGGSVIENSVPGGEKKGAVGIAGGLIPMAGTISVEL